MIDRQKIIQIFKASPTPTSIVLPDDPKFTFVQVNEAYTKMTQTKAEELIGNSLFESFPENPDEIKPTGVERLRNSFRKVIAEKQQHRMESIRYDIKLDDGQYKQIYWEVINTPVFDDEGNVEFIINSATNITEQVLSKRANRLMLNNSEDSFILLDMNLIIQSFNNNFAQNYKDIFGIEVKKGDSVLDYVQPERLDIVKGIYERVLKGETITGELPAKTKDGADRYFTIKYKPAEDEKGNIIGSFISILEKTKEHKAKLELEQNEARYRALAEHGNDVLFILNSDGAPFYASPSIENVLGYTQQEALEMDMLKIVHPDDIEMMMGEVQKCLENPGVPMSPPPARMKDKQGNWHWFEGTITNMLDDPAINGIVDNFREITDRYEAEQEVHEAKEKYQTLIQTIDGVVWEAEPGTLYVTYMSPQALSILGHDPDVWASTIHFWRDHIHPDDRKETYAKFEKFTKAGQNHELEYRYQKGNGEYIWVRDVVTVITENGKPEIIRGVIIDINKEKELQIELDKVYEMGSIGNWEVDMINDKLYWSDVVKKTFEVDPDFEPELETAIEFYTKGENRDSIQEAVDKAMAEGVSYDVELQITTAKGNKKWIRNIGKPEFKDGKCIRVYGSTQDITERKEAELELKRSHEALVERIKEQRCLYDIANLNDSDLSIPELLEKAADIIPQGMLFEEIAQARITWDSQHYDSKSFAGLKKKLSITEGKKSKSKSDIQVTVGYSKNSDASKDLRILEEEKVLLKAIHNQLSQKIDQILKRKQIREADQKFRNVVEHSTNMFYQHDLNGVLTYVSPQSIDFLGYTSKKAMRDWTDFITDHPINKKGEALTHKAIETGEVQEAYELQLKTASGNIIWVEVNEAPLLRDGKVTGIVGSLTDITERKKAHLSLKKAFEEKESILESIGDGFFTVNKNWIVTYWNRAAERLLHTPKQTILGNNLWDIFEDAVDLISYTNYHRALHEGKSIDFEDYYPTLDKWFDISAYPSEEGLSVFFKDITDRKKNEEEIRRINERFEKVTKATNDAIWDFDVSEDTLFWGKGFEKLFGYDLNEINPSFEFLISLIHPGDRSRVVQKIEQKMADSSISDWYEEYRFLRNDGSYAHVIDRAIFIRNKKGKVIRVVGAMTDLTKQKEYEESLQRLNAELQQRAAELAISNAELEQFAYVASHDLQEPLRMITSFLTQLDKKYSDKLDTKANEYINFAVEGAQRMRQIILDLLNYSRLHQEDIQRENVDLNKILNDAKSLENAQISDRKAKITNDELPTVKANSGAIKQVFQNVLNNGLKYQKPDSIPEIHISAKESDTHWKIIFKDNGIGINPEFQDNIFQIFQRLHTRDQYSGTGIGLAISKKIVERHGGHIWVESEEGKGSTFFFTIEK
ncbi:MAG TPA: PAS domain S-box protein [Gracilimonas sp.]|uniref:PAS domain-containing sensor histidine kinase n=1 Tax=Gracilimonas sp. TaxID=1974203 RepID=UPI002D834865|nr:PAS domain S-box protein [Gracilimonas sp.]